MTNEKTQSQDVFKDLSQATEEDIKKLKESLPEPETVQDFENSYKHLGMYSFLDTQANRYTTPFFCKSDLLCNRHYTMVLANEQMVQINQEHFDVYRLGYFNQETSEFIVKYERIIKGSDKKDEQRSD